MRVFVTAIGTDSGKTLVSAIMCEAFEADYWKPIQAGAPRDADWVKNMVSNKQSKILEERFSLKTPASPHASAKADNITMTLRDFHLPQSDKLIIEGAGGCLVPINDDHFIIDLITKFNCETVLVSNLYLGSINHTLLTLEALRSRSIKIKGIIFNGDSNPESESIILKHANVPCLLRIKREDKITKEIIDKYASMLKENLNSIE